MNTLKNDFFVFGDFVLEALNDETIVEGFDCGDLDLNEYFLSDSIAHRREMFTKSYCFHFCDDEIQNSLALVDFCNAEIRRESFNGIDGINQIPSGKREYSFFPAVKITRLGVSRPFQKHHIGSALLDTIKMFFISCAKTGCRFLLVDAYREALAFYLKNDFASLYVKKPENRRTLPLFFDLKSVS